jgi:hypothetical protein
MQVIPRSQAIARHELYVLLTSPQISTREKQQAWQQFLGLIEQERQMHQHYLARIVHPSAACGSTGYVTQTWYLKFDGDKFYSTLSFYKTTDCKAVTFDTATLAEETHTNGALDWYWSFDRYASDTYNVPNCPDMTY